VLLYQMIESGTGGARLLPTPTCSKRLRGPGRHRPARPAVQQPHPSWGPARRQMAPGTPWGDGHHHPRQFSSQARAAAKHLRDIQLRYATLLEPARAPPWTVPGPPGRGRCLVLSSWKAPGKPSVAEAQAMAITELAAPRRHRPWTGSSGPMLLAADDYFRGSRGGCRCPTCTNAAIAGHRGCRSPRSPGKGSGPMKTSGTGSPRTRRRRQSSCYTLLTPRSAGRPGG